MKRICAWCKKRMGPDVPPLDDDSETHGMCDACLVKIKKEAAEVHKTMKANPNYVPFKSLSIGDVFIFESEASGKFQFSGMATGPWIKTGSRKYVHVDNQKLEHRVGSINVKTQRMNPGAAYHAREAEQEERTEQRARRGGKDKQAAFHRGKAAAHRQSEAAAEHMGMNPGGRGNYSGKIAGVVYNRIIEIRAQKTGGSKPGFYRHPFAKNTAAKILAMSNGDLLIKSTNGKRLWEPFK